MIGYDIGLLILGLVILIFGGELLVRSAVSFAEKFGVSSFLIGVTVVSFGTSIPELMVSIQAAMDQAADIAIGNVLGSNIANIALVLGVSVVIRPLSITTNTYKLSWWVMLISSLLFILFLLDNVITKMEGLLLIAGLFCFIFFSIKRNIPNEESIISKIKIQTGILFFVLGAIGLYFGSELFVESAISIASFFNVPKFVIGITVVALGTSLPELVTSIVALMKGQNNISLGNLIGSNIFNVFAVLGITSLVQELGTSSILLFLDFGVMLAVILVFGYQLFIRKKISRTAGFILLSGYFSYILFSVF
ncbi:MAG: calcium/sodium antiporter [Bacteroidota bacterium]|nr:calcium/sodium antiporter [Bacteroidota bacterium]